MNVSTGFDIVGQQTLEVIAKADEFNFWMYKQFRSYLKGDVLEIGSGIGNISKFVIKDGFRATLSDLNISYVNQLKQKFGGEKNVSEFLSIDLLHPDFKNHYNYLGEKYDTVFLLNVIEHISDDKTAIQNCKFLLRNGGYLILLAPSYQLLYCRFDKELGHYRRYSLKRLVSQLRNHDLKIIHKQHFNFLGIGGWFLFGKILKRKMIAREEMTVFNKLVPLAKFLDHLFLNKAGLSVITIAEKNKPRR